MTEGDVWKRKPSRTAYADGTLYYFASVADAWHEELKVQWDLLVEENKQLREAVEMSAEEIKERMYTAWYQAGVKQGGILYSLELDRKKLVKAREWYQDQLGLTSTIDDEIISLGKILGGKK